MRKILTFSLLLAVSSEQCHLSQCGERSDEGVRPWHIQLKTCTPDESAYDYAEDFSDANLRCLTICDGTLIDKKWVMTAASCFRHYPQPTLKHKNITMRIVLGAQDQQDMGSQSIVISKIHVHPDYDHANENDIALVKLSEEAICGPMVNTICLPNKNQELPSEVWAIGWARETKWQDLRKSQGFNEVKISLVSNEDCQEIWGARNRTISRELCTQAPSFKTCPMSGSPIASPDSVTGKWIQSGFIHFGRRCGMAKNYPDVSVRVSEHIDWVRSLISI